MNSLRKGAVLLRNCVSRLDRHTSRRWLDYQPKHSEAHKYDDKALVDFQNKFYEIPEKDRTKANFHAAIELFRASRGSRGRGHVEFITVALKHLKDFGIHKDLDTYKALLNIFPKGVMIPTNVYQKMFLHYPVQQCCCVDVLDEMEYHGVYVDKEIHDIVVNAFGEYTYAGKKAKRMLYWLPKLRHTNHYLDRRLVEGKNLPDTELAQTALRMICRDAGTVLTNINVKKAGVSKIFDDWIVSAQSPLQRLMLRDMPVESTNFYIDGPQFVYVTDKRVEYALLTATPSETIADETFVDQRTMQDYGEDLHEKLFDTAPQRNVHEQRDETILALCVLETYTPRMASAWLNHLQQKNPALERSNVLIRIREPDRNLEPIVEYES